MADHLPEGQTLFTLLEVAERLKVSISTLHRWRKKGGFRAVKISAKYGDKEPRHWRVPREEVERLEGMSTPSVPTTPSVVVPDEGHTESRRWSGYVGGRLELQFMEMQLLKMTLDAEPEEKLQSVLNDFSAGELEEYCNALETLLGKAKGTLARVKLGPTPEIKDD